MKSRGLIPEQKQGTVMSIYSLIEVLGLVQLQTLISTFKIEIVGTVVNCSQNMN